jgi:predicted regulator of Ras-like GTPase activity (Roadblock/LC7/MglB family)
VIAPPADFGGLRLAPKAPEPAEDQIPELPVAAPVAALPPEPDNGPEPEHSEPAHQPEPFEGPRLILPVATLSAGWPDTVRAELAHLGSDATMALPVREIKAGLASGRIAFRWIDLRSWINPAMSPETAIDADLSLILPLKAVAPAYLAAHKNENGGKKTVTVDQSIPALFSPAAPEQQSATPECEPHPEPPASGSQPEPCAVESQPELTAVDLQPEPAVEPEPGVADSQPETPGATAAITAEHANPQEAPGKLGQLFGKPEKTQWTPAEIVEQTLQLPGVCGAIVALHEGLQVAHSLPEGIKSEVVAAFLPQIFARLNQYAEEMKLGEVDDLLFTTHGAHCQIYRLGLLYFAVLGRPGEPLPWRELRVIAEELARETKP